MIKIEDIKIFKQKINSSKEQENMFNKHMITLVQAIEMHGIDELCAIIDYFLEKQIIINDGENMLLSPSSFTVLCHPFEEIKARVEYYDSIGEIDALKEDITRLNSNGAIHRLEYLKQMGEPYKTPEGKYSNIPFKLRRFKSKYPSFSVEENAIPFINIEGFNRKIPIENPQETSAPLEQEQTNSIMDILSKPQTIGLNDETFVRYEKLSNIVRKIMYNVYGVEEVNDVITDNLIKLITNEIPDDKMLIYYAITFGKVLSNEEEKALKIEIDEQIGQVLEFTSFLDVNLGRAA